MSPDSPSNPGLTGRAPDIVGALRRQWPVIALCAVVAAVFTYMYVDASDVTYESKSTILLEALPGEVAPGGGRERTLDVDTQATVARSTDLLQRIGDRLDLTAVQVKNASRVEPAATGNVLFVYFEDDEATFAAEGALVYTEEFLAQRKASADAVAQRQYDAVQAQITTLQDEVEDLTARIEDELDKGDAGSVTVLAVLQQSQNLAIRDIATSEDELSSISIDQNPGRVIVDPRSAVNRTGLTMGFTVGGGTFVGLLIGAMIALLIDRRDDRYGSAIGLDEIGVQELGRLRFPDAPGVGQRMARRDYARLLARLGFSNGVTAGHRAILLVAVESTTVPPRTMAAVAEALAAEGPDNGLVTAIISPAEALVKAGNHDSNASHWHQFAASLADEMGRNDIVLVVADPFDRSIAGLAVASRVDQTVLLISEATRVNALVTVIEDLESVNAHDIGVVVLTRVPPRRRW